MSGERRQQWHLQSSGADFQRSSLARPHQRPSQQVADCQPSGLPTSNYMGISIGGNNNGDTRPPMKSQIPPSDSNYRHLRPAPSQSGQAADSSQSNRRLHNNNNNNNNNNINNNVNNNLADPSKFGRQLQVAADVGCQSASNGEKDGRQQCAGRDLLATSGPARRTPSDEMFPGGGGAGRWQHQSEHLQMAATRQELPAAGRHATADLEHYDGRHGRRRRHQLDQQDQTSMKSLDERHKHKHQQQQQQQQQHQPPRHSTMSNPNYEDDDDDKDDKDDNEPDQINYQADVVEYARELRRAGQRHQQQQQTVNNRREPRYANQCSSSAAHQQRPCPRPAWQQTQQVAAGPTATAAPAAAQGLHVNFHGRSSQSGDSNGHRLLNGDSRPDVQDYDDDEAESGRKKKYLTAKYGQQQMNLIKKRLKIEMWLYEQLQELAKETKSEADLDEIDIDLDQLLDMDDDQTRRHWLTKTLEPFRLAGGGAADQRIGAFIEDILGQSKLL